MAAMKNKNEAKPPLESIAISRAAFCWETEAWSGRVLHYYEDKDGTLVSYPTPQELAVHNNKNK